MNLVAPHLMVELRSAGFIEICGDLEEATPDIEWFACRLIGCKPAFFERRPLVEARKAVRRGTAVADGPNWGLKEDGNGCQAPRYSLA